VLNYGSIKKKSPLPKAVKIGKGDFKIVEQGRP
jgi:hypothetical protein